MLNTEQIKNGNSLISKFMGYRYYNSDSKLTYMYLQKKVDVGTDSERWSTLCTEGQESFHQKWDWIMPVAKKIQSLEDVDNVGLTIDCGCSIEKTNPLEFSGFVEVTDDVTLEESMFLVIVKFLTHLYK